MRRNSWFSSEIVAIKNPVKINKNNFLFEIKIIYFILKKFGFFFIGSQSRVSEKQKMLMSPYLRFQFSAVYTPEK
jgi:hypothetical protein